MPIKRTSAPGAVCLTVTIFWLRFRTWGFSTGWFSHWIAHRATSLHLCYKFVYVLLLLTSADCRNKYLGARKFRNVYFDTYLFIRYPTWQEVESGSYVFWPDPLRPDWLNSCRDPTRIRKMSATRNPHWAQVWGCMQYTKRILTCCIYLVVRLHALWIIRLIWLRK